QSAALAAQQQQQAALEAARQRQVDQLAAPIASAVRSGWFVFLGSFPHSEPETVRQRAREAKNNGFTVKIIDTDAYRSLASGYFSVVIGPFSRSSALQQLARVQPYVADAYIKQVR
ncbi:SPOR domain-containing protein, partial [Mesorhizobium sp. M0915]|uniref:SPOR domain-containing protein n=1 Tax=Mesorhizobium sp. M0915 TaxID=2957027 RepID=UPI00333666F9